MNPVMKNLPFPATGTNISSVVQNLENNPDLIKNLFGSIANFQKTMEQLSGNNNTPSELANDIENGTCVISSEISTKDIIIPPFGNPIYTKEERDQKLKQLAWLNTSSHDKKLSSGCSVLLTLFWDEFREIDQVIRREAPYSRLPNFKAVINSLVNDIDRVLGCLTIAGNFTGLYHGSCKILIKDLNIKYIQQQFTDNIKELTNDRWEIIYKIGFQTCSNKKNNSNLITNQIENAIEKSPGCKRLMMTLKLLFDVVCQEMHLLFSPLDGKTDISNHFSRINRRALLFKHLIKSESLFEIITKEVKHEFSVPIRGFQKFADYCDFILNETKKLEDKDDYLALKLFWLALKSNHHEKELTTLITNTDNFLMLKQKNNPESELYSQISANFNQIRWLFMSMIEETYLVLISKLLKLGSVTNDEMDICMHNLITAGKAIQNYSLDNIETQIHALPESSLKNQLRSTWEKEIKNTARIHLLPEIFKEIEFRLKRCKEKPEDRIERTINFRNVLLIIDEKFFYQMKITDSKLIKLGFSLEEEDIQIKRVHQEMHDLNKLHHDSLSASMESIKALIGRCFNEIDLKTEAIESKSKIEFKSKVFKSEKMSMQLIKDVENEQNQKKKKKRKKSPVKIINNNITAIDVITTSESEKFISPQKTDAKAETLTEIKQPVIGHKKVKAKTAFEELTNIQESLKNCKILLKNFENSKAITQADWQLNHVKNLEIFIENLIESAKETNFSADHIFEQINLIRHSVEALLGIATVFSEFSLEKVRDIGHHAGNLTANLLKDKKIPIGIRFWAFKLRQVPLSLSDANRCVNYSEEAFIEQRKLHDQGKELIKYLIKVDIESRSDKIDAELRKQLTTLQKRRLNNSVYFMEKILYAMCNPNDTVDLDLLAEETKIASQPIDLQFETSRTVLDTEITTDNIVPSSDFIPQLVENREQAILAIKASLTWIASIRIIAPVEGYVLTKQRTEKRDFALKNCVNYLNRLKEKPGPLRHNKPMSTILGQCELIRRLQKEILVAALYHGNHFRDGQAIVDALDIRYENSPVFLMNVLRSVSTNASKLPQVGIWLNYAHQSLSYPHKQKTSGCTFPANQIEKMIDKAHKKAVEMNSVEEDETLVVGNKLKTPLKRLNERKKLVEKNEAFNIFPELASFLHTLKHGFSVPTNAHLA
jgi:hypothetical protein